jgi:ubiquinol-cytochrome c reductase iron-sulfur subunit
VTGVRDPRILEPATRDARPVSPLGPITRRRERRGERIVLASFGVTMLTGLLLLILYALGGQTQLEGILLALCLGGLGVGIVIWAQELMSGELRIEERHPIGSGTAEVEELQEALVDEEGFTRRRALQVGLLGAVGGLASALAIPVLSLGPAPGRSLFQTPWKAGMRVVDGEGLPVRAADIPLDGVLTVFPEGFVGNAEAQTLLINAGADRLQLQPDQAQYAPDGFIALSKVCTHAGCPVGLYRAAQGQLICPCHQSTFDVLHGAVPTFGPAARPLPQLPIQRDGDGFIALGDFPEPVGPSFWDMDLGPMVIGDGDATPAPSGSSGTTG